MPPRGLRSGVLYAAASAALGLAGWLFVTRGSFDLTRLASASVTLHLDFDTFRRSAVAFVDGADIYATAAAYPNLNPPVVTVLLAPFAVLDVLAGYRLLALVTLVLVVASMALVARELRVGAVGAVAATTAVLASSPFLATIGLGQTYGLLTACLTGCWIAGRRGRPVVEAVALGLAVALKPSLALLLLLPAAARRWRQCLGAVAIASIVTIAGALAAGHAALTTWVALLSAKPLETYFDNASLIATTVRLLAVGPWAHPLLALPSAVALGVGYGLAAAVVALTLLRITRTRRAAPGGALWALAAASLLASPLTWNNYLVILMPGVLLLLARGRRAAACAALALPLVGLEWPPLWIKAPGPTAIPLSLYCGTLLLYWFLFLGEVGRGAADEQEPDEQRPDGERPDGERPVGIGLDREAEDQRGSSR